MRIVFFDGYCNLCNSVVDWLMRVDHKKAIQFASLQGTTARDLLKAEALPQGLDPNTVIYFRQGKQYNRSSAALMILWDLGGAWALSAPLFLVPKFLRDLVYNLVAKTRYRVFGKKDTCRLPTPEERGRILP